MIKLHNEPFADYSLGDFKIGVWVRLLTGPVACIFSIDHSVNKVGVIEFTDTHTVPQVVYYKLNEPCQEIEITDIDIAYRYNY